MNPHNNLILIKNELKTTEIKECKYNPYTKKYDVRFNNNKIYNYAYDNVVWLRKPKMLNPSQYRIKRGGRELFMIQAIFVFSSPTECYWHICFEDGSEKDFREHELQITKSCLLNEKSNNVFEYLKQIAFLNELTNDDGEKLLEKQYEKINYIGDDTVLALYLNPDKGSIKAKMNKEVIPIFPFGCNKSQYKATKRALENRVSVIQGPPGTGKTQTILNIIANILIQGKNVLVVSSNNSAVENIYEKLSSEKYNMGFIVAQLGNRENKESLIEGQSGLYPNIESWRMDNNVVNLDNIKDMSYQLKEIFDMQERLALLKQEISKVKLENKYFESYLSDNKIDTNSIKISRKLSANMLMNLWQEFQDYLEKEKEVTLFTKIKNIFIYRIVDWNLYKQDKDKVIFLIQRLFYKTKYIELSNEIRLLEKKISNKNNISIDDMCDKSLFILKNILFEKYKNARQRAVFSMDDLWKNTDRILDEYPVILCTTFSSRSSMNKDTVYDYAIMDEASQVDIATGALALSCARNVVIVGDTKQLPNVISNQDKSHYDAVFKSFNIGEEYKFTKSFLQSVLDTFINVPQTLLREHYRCHPKIINFCNQKFYNGELIIMTQDNNEKDVISVVKTVEGNHERNHYSQRQIDIIKQEVLPAIKDESSNIGIIAPYNNQVNAIKKEIENIDVATVHKFQGKEKNSIIISTVDDIITEFTDDSNLINVAVSRAKEKLCIVISGNKQPENRNICDLVSYIEYNNFNVQKSNVYSVFDYLYKQYTNKKKEYLRKHKRVSDYDSENLMYTLISEVLMMDKFSFLDVICHQPLNMVIKISENLNEKEIEYAKNSLTHLDFLIYNKVTKKPVLVIEVDGYGYHAEGTKQAERDALKNHILELYGIPLIRFKTNGSGEKELLEKKLSMVVANKM